MPRGLKFDCQEFASPHGISFDCQEFASARVPVNMMGRSHLLERPLTSMSSFGGYDYNPSVQGWFEGCLHTETIAPSFYSEKDPFCVDHLLDQKNRFAINFLFAQKAEGDIMI